VPSVLRREVGRRVSRCHQVLDTAVERAIGEFDQVPVPSLGLMRATESVAAMGVPNAPRTA